jgi:diaminopimelate decarboxylase
VTHDRGVDLFAADRAVRDGSLLIGGCRLADLAEQFGTPTIVVAEHSLRARARAYREELAARWPNSRVVFASKAFPATGIQRVMVEEGLGLDVAGGGEILAALKAGADPSTLVLHGNAKTDDELRLAIEARVGLVVLDNADDVDRLESLLAPGTRQDVLIRVIPEVEADTHASVLTGQRGSKFGLGPDAALALAHRVRGSSRLRLRGLHSHVGSQILDPQPFARAVEALARLGEFEVYDLGGGLGSRYTYADDPPSLPHFLDVLIDAVRAELAAGSQIILEPGRSIVAETGCTLYRVTTIKPGEPSFIGVDGGMADNLEVALYGQRFEAVLADRVDEPATRRVSIVGRHCESGDILVDGIDLPEPRRGDVLAVPVTGAYCLTMSNTYNGARRVPVVLVGEGRARLIVRRDSWHDLLARDVD